MKPNWVFLNSLATAGILILTINVATAQEGTKRELHQMGQMPAGKMEHSQHHMQKMSDRQPTLPGQSAFGAIQEIVAILEADPNTDWSNVNISSLRSHLVDMNLLVMEANVRETSLKNGIEVLATGKGRVLKAIQSMVPAHAPMINGFRGWNVKSELTKDGAKLTVTADSAKEIVRIQGLGFYGLMVSDSHHQTHHLGLARGINVHAPTQ